MQPSEIYDTYKRLRNSTGRTLSHLHQWSVQSTGRRSLQGHWNYELQQQTPMQQFERNVALMKQQGIAVYDDVIEQHLKK